MLSKQNTGMKHFNFIKSSYTKFLLLLCVFFIYHSHSLCSEENIYDNILKTDEASIDKKTEKFKKQPLIYYLNITDFAESFIEIPTSNVSGDNSTINSRYLAGRAPIYDQDNKKVGTCSASFLCMQNADGIYTDISNFLSVDSGLIVTWFTPTKLINLELDSIINSMVTECMVVASTQVGVNPFYGQTFNLIVSSENGRIYFKFMRTGTIF